LNFTRAIRLLVRFSSPVAVASCAPVIGVAGAQFPVWMFCLIAGIIVSVSLRPLFITVGIDDWMTPRPLIYSCLALVVAFLCWLLIGR
jgi:hypothetical protein